MTEIVIQLGWFDFFPQGRTFKTVSHKEWATRDVWSFIPENAQLKPEYETDDGIPLSPHLVSARTHLSKDQAVPVVNAWVIEVMTKMTYSWSVKDSVDMPHQYSVTISGSSSLWDSKAELFLG